MARMRSKSVAAIVLGAGAALIAGWYGFTADRTATQAALPTRHATAVPRGEAVSLVAPQLQEAARSTAPADEDHESLDLSTRVALLEEENGRLMEVNRLLDARVRELERPASAESEEEKMARIEEVLRHLDVASSRTTSTGVRLHINGVRFHTNH